MTGIGATHPYPLEVALYYGIYADVRTFPWFIITFGVEQRHVGKHSKRSGR